MPISSNALIHFTSSKEKLKSIFEENFRLGYCKESTVVGGTDTSCYVPMVSFCDIPLSQVKEHISKYGSYGVGLTREWGIRNKLNPVLYIEQSSLLSNSYQLVANTFLVKAAKEIDRAVQSPEYFRAVVALGEILSYAKNYQGTLVRRDGTVMPDYRFADEREWRYVLPSINDATPIMSETTFNSAEGKARASELIATNRLIFHPDDIKYVIIKDETEIHEFVEHLRNAKRVRYTPTEIDRLTTRIITAEQIAQDF